MRRRAMAWFALAVLASCSASDSTDDRQPEPETYSFRKADLFRETPRDICRTRDREFVQRLMSRINDALSASGQGSATFEEFFVQSSPEGQGQQAAVRFSASDREGKAADMFAVGAFENCTIGPMKASVGRDLFLDEGKQAFDIP